MKVGLVKMDLFSDLVKMCYLVSFALHFYAVNAETRKLFFGFFFLLFKSEVRTHIPFLIQIIIE